MVNAKAAHEAGRGEVKAGETGAVPPRLLDTSTSRLALPSCRLAVLPSITVELFGVPRLLIGERVVAAAGATLAELAVDLVRRYPAFAGKVLDGESGWPLDGYSFVVDEQFTRDQERPLPAGTSVILVASAAGG
jgi:hypothetical protein